MSDTNIQETLPIDDGRRATLEVRETGALAATDDEERRRPVYVILTASNGEPLLYGETHPTAAAGEAGRRAVLRAMIEVLEDNGYLVGRDPHANGEGVE